MKRLCILFFILFFEGNLFSQCTLTIRQVGSQTDTLLVANYEDSILLNIYKRINDSTLVFTDNPIIPDCIILVIDRKTRWYTRIWIDGKIKQKEIIIDYSTKTVKVPSPHEWDAITQQTLALDSEEDLTESDSISAAFVDRNPGSYFSLWLLAHGMYRNDPTKKLTTLNNLSSELRNYPEYRQIKASLSERKYPVIGDPFKEFSLSDIKDSIFNTELIKNKWILLDFWSNGCAPCVRGMDAFVNLYNSLDTSRIAFISVSLDQNRNVWKNSKTSHKIKWANVWQPDNFYGELCLNYNVTAMPFFIIFNREKKIHLITFGDELGLIKSTLQSID